MKRLGTLDRTAQGLALVKLEGDELPETGATVVDESLETVGSVVEVIGPVAAPWAVVDPADRADPVAHLGRRLYVRSR